MAENTIRLGQYELLKYSFGAFLTCSDVATDIIDSNNLLPTATVYLVWLLLGVCSFAIVPINTCIPLATLQTREQDCTGGKIYFLCQSMRIWLSEDEASTRLFTEL